MFRITFLTRNLLVNLVELIGILVLFMAIFYLNGMFIKFYDKKFDEILN